MRGWLSLGFHVRENGGDVYLVPVRYPACLQWVPMYIPHCSGSKGGDGEVSEQNQLSAVGSGWQETLLHQPQQLKLKLYIVLKSILEFEESLFSCMCLTPQGQQWPSLRELSTEPWRLIFKLRLDVQWAFWQLWEKKGRGGGCWTPGWLEMALIIPADTLLTPSECAGLRLSRCNGGSATILHRGDGTGDFHSCFWKISRRQTKEVKRIASSEAH